MSGTVGQIGARSGIVGSTTDSTQLEYEEGEWEFQSEGGSVVSGAKMGRYTRIGNLVTITGQFQQGSGQSTGNLIGTNIPFGLKPSPTNGNGMCTAGVRMWNQDLSHMGATYVTLDAGGKLEFWEHNDNTNSARVPRDDGAYIAFTLTYQTT